MFNRKLCNLKKLTPKLIIVASMRSPCGMLAGKFLVNFVASLSLLTYLG